MTREEIIALAKQHGASAYTSRHYPDETYVTFPPGKLEAFFHAAQAIEREACAKVCEAKVMTLQPFKAFTGNDVAHAIRQNNKHLAAAIRNRTAS